MTPVPPGLREARETFLLSGDDALLPIVDAHHHFWDLANPHPWLDAGERIPFRYGDYGPICRNYLPADHLRSAGGHRLVRSVVMEGEWDPADPVGEANWLRALAQREGTPQALSAQAWLDRDDLDAVLAAYASAPLAGLVKSVRHKPRCATRATWREGWNVARVDALRTVAQGLREARAPPGSTSSCRRRGGTWTRRWNWRATSPGSR